MVFGSRVKLLSNKITRNPMRHYLGRVFATFASITIGLAVYDTQCGAKVFHNSILKELFFRPFSSRWIFDVEIFMRFRNSQSIDRAKEVVLDEWTGYDGSKIRLKDLIRIPFELIKIARNDRKI
jgi:dolichyl-phosphate beta-glucosyltransferase